MHNVKLEKRRGSIMRKVRLKIKLVTLRVHSCGSTNVKKRFRGTRNRTFVRDRLTGEKCYVDSKEYDKHRMCKVCVDCKICSCESSMVDFFNPLYRTCIDCLTCGKETKHEYNFLKHQEEPIGVSTWTCVECGKTKRLRALGGRTFEILKE